MTVTLIRHGQTQGNLERRYVGSADQPLCPSGREALRKVQAPVADALYVSPKLRCRETARILYPGMAQEVVDGLRETDFGAFELHTYEELKDDPAYQAWLETSGEAAPPGGESKSEQRERILAAFLSIVRRHREHDRITLIVHGGTIMTLLEALEPGHQFYAWQAPNGGGFRCRWADGKLADVEKL